MNRYVELVGAAVAAAPQTSAVVRVDPSAPSVELSPMHTVVPGLGAGAVGAYAWKKHRVLGFFAGQALGAAAYPVYRNVGRERTRALSDVGVTAAGVAGSLMWKKHPVVGFVAGIAAGLGVSAMAVPGSTGHAIARRWRNR